VSKKITNEVTGEATDEIGMEDKIVVPDVLKEAVVGG